MQQKLIALVAAVVLVAAVAPASVAGATSAPASAQFADQQPSHSSALLQEQDSLTCEFPLELEDGTGETVTLEEEPDSVVALQPSDAQILFEIGAEEKVDGMPVGQYTEYLDADDELDITDDSGVQPITEEVIDREPDIVLAADAIAGEDIVEQLRDAGVTVYVFQTEDSLDGVAENIRLTGQLVGECEGAQASIDWMNERLEIIQSAVEDGDHPLAYYPMGGGFTPGSGTFQDEILTTAGVENLGAEAGLEGWAEISEETVIEEDPEWIVYGDSWEEPPVGDAVMGTTAYENDQFVTVDDNFMSQPGPLVVYAIEDIAQEVHPDAYEEAAADLEDEANDDAETESGGNESDAADGEETDDSTDGDETDGEDDESDESIPGFGAPVAVIAGLLAVFLLRR